MIAFAACLQKTGGFARNWPLARVALSFIVPAHFPNQISKGDQLNSQKHGQGCGLANAKKYNYEVKMAFYTPLVCLSLVL
jgi:hypothetical protein